MVLRTCADGPVFLNVGTTLGLSINAKPYAPVELQAKWVNCSESPVIYIGKAGGLDSGGATLRSRLSLYMRLNEFHSGGRAIWQLSDAADLLVCWKPTPGSDPRAVEKQMLSAFVAE